MIHIILELPPLHSGQNRERVHRVGLIGAIGDDFFDLGKVIGQIIVEFSCFVSRKIGMYQIITLEKKGFPLKGVMLYRRG